MLMCCDQIKFCFKALYYYYLTEIKSRNDSYEKGIPMTENICCSTTYYAIYWKFGFTKDLQKKHGGLQNLDPHQLTFAGFSAIFSTQIFFVNLFCQTSFPITTFR